MDNDDEKAYLVDIAKEKGVTNAKDILAVLLPYDIIYARVENVDLLMMVDESNKTLSRYSPIQFIKLKKDYLRPIFRNGGWSGSTLESSHTVLSGNPDAPEKNDYPMYVSSPDGITISLEELVVYKQEFAEVESQHPGIFAGKFEAMSEPEISPRKEKTLYALIGVLLDLLVDEEGRNALPLPNVDDKYLFKSQANLIERIEKYDIYGLGESSLHKVFGEANRVINQKMQV